MSNKVLAYIEKDSPIHKLTGATKLICFLLWSFAAMLTYDTRLILFMLVFGIIIFKISKMKFSDISVVVYFILIFLVINDIAIFIFSPYQGVKIYGTRHNMFHMFGSYYMTQEQLFYEANVTLKYFTIMPVALLFLITTNPSEFASSLSRIGVSYKIAYSVAIALRYIPDIQGAFQDISFSQQARGIDMSKKEKFGKRIKNAVSILMPLIFSSIDMIDTISCAMELRGFGKKDKRTWYNARPFLKKDFSAITICGMLLVVSITLMVYTGGRFYNPFK